MGTYQKSIFSILPILLAIFLISGANSAMHSIANEAFVPSVLIYSSIFGMVCVLFGNIFITLLRIPVIEVSPFKSVLSLWLIGFILVSFALMLMAFTTTNEIGVNFWILAIVGFLITSAPTVSKTLLSSNFSKFDFIALMLIICGSVIWSQENLRAMSIDEHIVTFHPWYDLYFHASKIDIFANSTGMNDLSDQFHSGRPLPLYHYGSYMASALISNLSGVTAYPIAAGWYAPVGFILTGLAAWTLGSSTMGSYGGLGAVFAVTLLPDPSFYKLGNGWTSYYFFQTVGIGGAYATAILALAWAFLFRFLESSKIRYIVVAFIFAGFSALFKSTIFVAYSFLLPLFAIVFFKGFSKHQKLLYLFCALAILAVAVEVLEYVPTAPTLTLSTSGAEANFNQIIRSFGQNITSLHAAIKDIVTLSPSVLVMFAPLLITSATYGLVLPLAAFVFIISLRGNVAKPWLYFPIFILLNHAIVSLLLAPNISPRGDLFEIIHKTFVWPYFAISIWAFANVANILSEFRTLTNKLTTSAFILVSSITALYCGKNVQSNMSFSKGNVNRTISRGLYDIGVYLRERSNKNDVLQNENNYYDMELTAISGVDSYILTPYYRVSQKRSEEENERINDVEKLLKLDKSTDVIAGATVLGIDWLILSPSFKFGWKSEMSPVYSSNGYELYLLNDSQQ
ncbi:MAG: hypothetical protein ACJAT7_003654 [Psychromonas sp.]|jgi:hypothetical protein